MRLVVVAVLVVAVAIGFVKFLETDRGFKLKVAVNLFGYDGLLDVVKGNIAERLVGKKQTKTRSAFHELLETLSEVHLEYLSPKRGVASEEDIAEGTRLITHALRLGLQLHLEYDPLRPYCVHYNTPMMKILGDNPDAFYLACSFDTTKTYRIRGRFQGEVYTSFTLAEAPCPGCFASAVFQDVNSYALKMKTDDPQAYELYVGPKKPDFPVDNWISSKPSSDKMFVQLITRHYFENNTSIRKVPGLTPYLDAQLVGEEPGTATFPRSDEEMADRLHQVDKYVREHTMNMKSDPKSAPKWFSFTSNVFGPPMNFRNNGSDTKDGGGGLGAVDIVYSAAPWVLKQDEGLLIEGTMPNCKFANVVLWNRYMQTLDYLHHQTSLNRVQMKSLKSQMTGSFKILLAPSPPKDASVDWLDTQNRKTGTVFWRFILPDDFLVEPIKATVVKLGTV